jgi:lipoprotein-releasing system ATP-binding protein
MGTLDRPSAGRIIYDETDVFSMKDEELARFRNRRIGFVFQFHHLLPEFTAVENVMMPALIMGQKAAECRARAMELLTQAGIGAKAEGRPGELSGGEQQRIALARALMNKPAIVLADEPTGNLDTANAAALHELFRQLRDEQKQSFVIVTHNEGLAKMANRILRIRDGAVHAE